MELLLILEFAGFIWCFCSFLRGYVQVNQDADLCICRLDKPVILFKPS